MNKKTALMIYICSTLIAAISQIVLKKAADKQSTHKWIYRFVNLKVIVSNVMLLGTIFMSMIAMRYISYKMAPVFATLSYIFVLLLSCLVLKERINRRQLLGIIMIFAGICVFNLN